MTLKRAVHHICRSILTAIAMVVLWPHLQGMNVIEVGCVAVVILAVMTITDM